MSIAKHRIWPSFAWYSIFPIRLYFFNTLARTKILNKEKTTTSRHVCLCFFSLSYIPQLVLSSLAFLLSKAFHHISFLQQIQQLLFCLQPSSHTLSEKCDMFFPHHAFSGALYTSNNLYILSFQSGSSNSHYLASQNPTYTKSTHIFTCILLINLTEPNSRKTNREKKKEC